MVDRIRDHTKIAPSVKSQLLSDFTAKPNDMTNAQARIVYKDEMERGVSPFNPVLITPHAQYRMDLRGVTVPDIQSTLNKFRQWFMNPRNRPWLEKLQQSGRIQLLVDGKTGATELDLSPRDPGTTVRFRDGSRIVVFGLEGRTLVVVTTFIEGSDDVRMPPGGCPPRKVAYRAPAGDLSGYRTYPSEKPSKGIDAPSGTTIHHSPGESPRSDRERAAPMRPGQKEELLQKTPANTVFNTPGPSEPGQKIHVRSPGTRGEDYGHPYKLDIMPRRTEAALYPTYNERQRAQKGKAKLYYKRYYKRNRGKIRARAKRDYLHKKFSPAFKRERKYRNSQQYGWRFNRLPSRGYRSPAERSRDYRQKQRTASSPIPFYHPNYGEGFILDVADQEVVIRQTDSMGGEPLGVGTVPFFAFLRGVQFNDEADIDRFFDLADEEFDRDEAAVDEESVRLATFYRETFRPGRNMDPGDGPQNLGEPSPYSPTLPYYDTDRNYRTPGELMNNIGPTDNNPGSAKVIPEGHDFENRKAAGSDLVSRIRKLLPALARAAQKEYDAWDQDEEGYDEECGTGGICDRIANAFSSVLSHLPDVEIIEGGQEGDDHAYLIALTDTEAVAVDIPPKVYETGGGYSWKKKPGVRFSPSHIVLEQLDRGDFEGEGRFASSVRVAAKMSEILQGIDPGVVSRSRSVSPRVQRSDVKNIVYSFSVPGGQGKTYTVKVKGVPPTGTVRTISKMDLRLSCTCDFWRWQGPEHWAKAGDYLYGKPRGTAASPVEKDPDGRNRVCKHVAAVLDQIKRWPAFQSR